MKKLLAVQISLCIVISGGLGGLLVFTDSYYDVRCGIVSVLCLSCIKLEPKTQLDFTFDTVDNHPHSPFVLANLTKGPVFLAYREDVCAGCDIMEPILQDIFDVTFEKEEFVVKTVVFNETEVTFIHMNLDHVSGEFWESYSIYDKDDVGGVPMFSIITVGYDRGFIKPYYTTAYGTLNQDIDEERREALMNLISDAIDLYTQFHHGYSES